MLGLLQPIWLFAIAGIVIPVMIHLWNNKQGRVLAIGSIDFLDKTSRRKARSRRISDWWLLILRCLLLILLVILLGGPFWRYMPDQSRRGWVMMTREIPDLRLAKMRDSLLAAGFERHIVEGAALWKDFSTLDKEAPAGVPFYVFTDGQLQHFYGERPVTSRQVNWYVSESRDSTVHWIEHAWARGADSVTGLEGSSGPTGISFHFAGVDKEHTAMDTTIWRAAVYTDEKYNPDGNRVEGVVKSLEQFTRRNISVRRYKAENGPAAESDSVDWLFWLSARPLPERTRAANVLLYEQGREIPVDTWIRDSDIPVEKVTEQSRQLPPIWSDGFGRPILAMDDAYHGRRYHFFSHFDPSWNGLVWSPEFPVLMRELLWSKETRYGKRPVRDTRVIDPAQVLPSRVGAERSAVTGAQATFDLSTLVWILIFLTLTAERILSFKRSKNG